MTQGIPSRFRWSPAIRIGVLVACRLFFGGPHARAEPAGNALRASDFELRTPTAAIPYYHFTVRLALPREGPVHIRKLRVNSRPVRNYFLLSEDESLDPHRPRNRRRMVIAGALKGPRAKRTYKHPTLIGRLDWRNNAPYALEIALSVGAEKSETLRAKARANAPAKGGYWDAAWKHYQSVVVSEMAGRNRTGEPVEVTLLFYPDTLGDAAHEIRVLRYDDREKVHREVLSQVLDIATVDATEPPVYDEHGKRKPATFIPTSSATIVFPADVPAHGSAVYLVFYGNPNAPAPGDATDLNVSGTAPGLIVENNAYRLKLHDASGMLDEVTLKSKPRYTFVHKKETNGAIQWNPGCYAPPRAWVHLSDWEPGRHDYEYEDVRGPIMFMTRRWGQMPLMPELACSMEYRFYAGTPYFVMRSSIHVRHDVAVQALRNAEVVFERKAFSEAAWPDRLRKKVETRRIVSAPDLTEWTMPDDTPWIAFFDRKKGCGYAGIQMRYANGGLAGRTRAINPYMYVTAGPWIYWTRALVYPYGGHNPQQLTRLAAGSVFLEEWAYLPFELSDEKDRPFRAVEEWQGVLAHPLHVRVEDPIDPRMEIPSELYLEPTSTGWEGEAEEN